MGKKQNLADAWLAAGYKCTTRAVARNNACELFRTNPYASVYVAKLIEKQQQRLEKSADDVIQELIKIGFSNVQDYIEKGNKVKDLSQIPRGQATAIESIQVTIRHDSGDSDSYTEKITFKTHSKLAALKELLDRWQGRPRQQVDVKKVVVSREITDKELAEMVGRNEIPETSRKAIAE